MNNKYTSYLFILFLVLMTASCEEAIQTGFDSCDVQLQECDLGCREQFHDAEAERNGCLTKCAAKASMCVAAIKGREAMESDEAVYIGNFIKGLFSD